jgi:hypothetical protein
LSSAGVALVYVGLSWPANSAAFMIPGLALSKIYGNSILALLNSRLSIQGGRNELNSDCVVDHFAGTGRQPELPRNDPGVCVSLLAQSGFELEEYHPRH